MLLKILLCLGIIVLANGANMPVDKMTVVEIFLAADLLELLKDDLTEDYMKEQYWLTMWLRAHSLHVKSTYEAIKQFLQLRNDQNVAGIMSEDWSDMRVLFPYSRNITDKSGRPVVYVDMAQWDIAAYLTSTEAANRLIRYVVMMTAESEAQVRQLRAEGRNINQYTHLCNIAGFSLTKHICVQCAYFYRTVVKLLTPHAAVNAAKVVLVNVPYPFKMVYFLWSDESRQLIQLYGQDQIQLTKMLDEYIERDQLPIGILTELTDNSEGLMVWDKEL